MSRRYEATVRKTNPKTTYIIVVAVNGGGIQPLPGGRRWLAGLEEACREQQSAGNSTKRYA